MKNAMVAPLAPAPQVDHRMVWVLGEIEDALVALAARDHRVRDLLVYRDTLELYGSPDGPACDDAELETEHERKSTK